MSERPYWVSILQWTIWALVMFGLSAWFGKARRKPASASDPRVLAYPVSAMVLALVCVGFFVAGVVLTLFASAEKAPWWTTAIFGGLAVISVHFLADSRVSRYSVSEQGLQYRSIFVRERFFAWKDVRSVTYAQNLRWFIVKDSEGHVARVSIMMSGLPIFAQLLLNNVDEAAISASAAPILRRTAKGDPPSVFP